MLNLRGIHSLQIKSRQLQMNFVVPGFKKAKTLPPPPAPVIFGCIPYRASNVQI